MQIKAENLLNPHRYYLSQEAKKRLKWLYVLYYECHNNVTLTANKVGISREWLSKIKSIFEKHCKNPRALEPVSKAPHNANNRERISQETENKIIEIRDKRGWGKEKISKVLKRDYKLKASPSTCNRYLHRHLKIEPKISARNKKAWAEKKLREGQNSQTSLKVKYRPPKELKDFKPGALIEKDMKLVPTINKIRQKSILDNKYHVKDHFNYQHTFIDSFTRIRVLELTEEPDSQGGRTAYQIARKKFPFNLGSVNTDSGGENGKDFAEQLQADEVIQFYSRAGTPTDNPRVERSHLTDSQEHYSRGNKYKCYQEQKTNLKDWEHTYNFIRPHQALDYLTPSEFYELWKVNPDQAYEITNKWQKYLDRQRKQQSTSRRIKRQGQIDKLMQFIEAKLKQKNGLKVYKEQLIKCELCSWT